jgi:hypothetical protein
LQPDTGYQAAGSRRSADNVTHRGLPDLIDRIVGVLNHDNCCFRVLSNIAANEKIRRKVSSNERSRPLLSREYRLTRLAAGVSGYICDKGVTKCVAVLKQHGGFPPTVPSR